uniref:Uncharacterized protein n=1 Tax=Octopus bimaculoides TaxID=37653 RepID=A0A0L8I7E1_OCTBM
MFMNICMYIITFLYPLFFVPLVGHIPHLVTHNIPHHVRPSNTEKHSTLSYCVDLVYFMVL